LAAHVTFAAVEDDQRFLQNPLTPASTTFPFGLTGFFLQWNLHERDLFRLDASIRRQED
jgi:hypothetical protein